MRTSLIFGVGLALIVAAPAVAQGLPAVPTSSLPALPRLPVPTVVPAPQLPSVPSVPSLPALPAVPAVPSLPALPGVGSQGVGSESVTSSGGSSGSAAASAGARAPAGGGNRGGSLAATSPGQPTGTRSATVPSVPTARQVAEPSTRSEVRRDRRLRAKVRRLEPCVGELSHRERRVLTLRAGLGDERPQTRRRVARTLRLSVQRVGRVERRGLRRLRDLQRAGRCSGAVGGGTMAADHSSARGGFARALGLVAMRALKGAAATPSDRVEVKSERESSGSTPKIALGDARPLKPPPVAALVDRGTDLTLVLLGLMAAGAAVLFVRSARRSPGSDSAP